MHDLALAVILVAVVHVIVPPQSPERDHCNGFYPGFFGSYVYCHLFIWVYPEPDVADGDIVGGRYSGG